MIDKRKLIREILRYNPSENSFFDLKEDIDLSNSKAKAKFLKHISGLSNSNQSNNSYLIFGIENKTRNILGLNWRDDALFQDLIRNNLNNPPRISYDNVIFPDLPHDKFVGLLTIFPNRKHTTFKNSLSKISKGSRFFRYGSQTLLETILTSNALPKNKQIVDEIHRLSRVSLELLLNEFVSFYKNSSPEYSPSHIVFNEQYVVCYSFWREKHFDEDDLLSEVTVILLNENISLFISAVDYAKILTTKNSFVITKMAHLYFNKENHFIPFEETKFIFNSNSDYKVEKQIVFCPPKMRRKDAESIIKRYQEFLSQYPSLDQIEKIGPAETLCDELLICVLNGYSPAKDCFLNYLNGEIDGCVAEAYSKAKEIYESQTE